MRQPHHKHTHYGKPVMRCRTRHFLINIMRTASHYQPMFSLNTHNNTPISLRYYQHHAALPRHISHALHLPHTHMPHTIILPASALTYAISAIAIIIFDSHCHAACVISVLFSSCCIVGFSYKRCYVKKA